jgi:hypothetical protein
MQIHIGASFAAKRAELLGHLIFVANWTARHRPGLALLTHGLRQGHGFATAGHFDDAKF